MTTVSITDVRRAFQAHVDALERCGIHYDGRLVLSEGSKLYGNAYRINLTDFPHPCQERRWIDRSDGLVVTWPHDHEREFGSFDRYSEWDHADCTNCHGTRVARCSGRNDPPIGSSFLGMTKREAYDALVARTSNVYDVAAALEVK